MDYKEIEVLFDLEELVKKYLKGSSQTAKVWYENTKTGKHFCRKFHYPFRISIRYKMKENFYNFNELYLQKHNDPTKDKKEILLLDRKQRYGDYDNTDPMDEMYFHRQGCMTIFKKDDLKTQRERIHSCSWLFDCFHMDADEVVTIEGEFEHPYDFLKEEEEEIA